MRFTLVAALRLLCRVELWIIRGVFFSRGACLDRGTAGFIVRDRIAAGFL